MKYAVIEQHNKQHITRMMCRAMEVSRSGYYDWRDRPASARAQRHRGLTAKIRGYHKVSRDTYGSPRIHTDLLESGGRVGENTVVLRMQRAGIVPKTVRKFRVTTGSRKTVPGPNLLEQQFTALRTNQRWVSDITAQGSISHGAVKVTGSLKSLQWSEKTVTDEHNRFKKQSLCPSGQTQR